MFLKCVDCGKITFICAMQNRLCTGCKLAEIARNVELTQCAKAQAIDINSKFLVSNPDRAHRALAEVCFLMNIEI